MFRVNYLGGDMPTFTLNFSRPGNQVVGQYYNFLRLGRAGYSQVMGCLSQTARWLGDELRESEHFEVISDGSAIPVVSFRLAGDLGYTEFDVSHALRAYGWQVPAYTMPEDATDITVLRIVVREGFSADLARALRDDIITALEPTSTSSSPAATSTSCSPSPTSQSSTCLVLEDSTKVRPQAHVGRVRRGSGTIGGGDMTMQTTELTTSLTPSANAEAVVDLAAIAHNVRVLREHAGSAQVMAVVKADGYGHGAVQVARAALAAGAAEIGVATIDEALALRRDGITAPVLAWLHPPGTDFAPALEADVEVAVSSVRQLGEVLDAVERTGHTANDHRQGGHRAEPQRCRRRRVSGDADRAAPGRGRRARSGCAASCRIWCTATTRTTPSTICRRSG